MAQKRHSIVPNRAPISTSLFWIAQWSAVRRLSCSSSSRVHHHCCCVCEGFWLRGFGQRQIVERVCPLDVPGLTARLELLDRVLPDRLQHHEARLFVPPARRIFGSRYEQTVIHEGRQRLQ